MFICQINFSVSSILNSLLLRRVQVSGKSNTLGKIWLHKTAKAKQNYCQVWWATEWEFDREFIKNHVTYAQYRATVGDWQLALLDLKSWGQTLLENSLRPFNLQKDQAFESTKLSFIPAILSCIKFNCSQNLATFSHPFKEIQWFCHLLALLIWKCFNCDKNLCLLLFP